MYNPDKAVELWDNLLKKGKSFGLKPCGLGARDSLRIEAGLPLYGHELAGKFKISPCEAGYGWAVNFEKDFFIGKSAIAKKASSFNGKIVRLQFSCKKGIRPLRENDGVIDIDGTCIGKILSCAKVANKQIALAYVERKNVNEGQNVRAYYLARSQKQREKGVKEHVYIGEKLDGDIGGVILSRFAKF